MRDRPDKEALHNIDYYAKASTTKYMIYYNQKPLYMSGARNIYMSPATARRVFMDRTGACKALVAQLIADGKLDFKTMQ